MSFLFLLTLVMNIIVTMSDNPIKHLIILMMENRSFDHILGWLKQNNTNIDGLNGNEYNCVTPNDSLSQCIYVNKHGYDIGPDDPYHDFTSISQQIYGINKNVEETEPAHMNGFVWNANMHNHNLSNVMSMFTIDNNSAPILNTLGLNYGIFNEWFCSVPSSTDPNRAFAMSGTANGMITNFNGTLWNQQSYFDFLRERNVTWKGYYDEDVWALAYFEDTNKKPNSLNIKPFNEFYDDLKSNNLSSFIWLQPSLTTHPVSGPPNWQHPDASVALGEQLIQTVYENLRDSKYWNSSALIITYDEHGGFYDHVNPPQNDVPSPDNVYASNGFKFDRLGVRIPTVIVSPWINKGTIINEPENGPYNTSKWESTSNLATANNLFNITDSISDRQSWAATYDYLFLKRNEPRTDNVYFKPIKGWTMNDVIIQASKPLNDHLSIQVQFYCKQLNINPCPTFENQGQASQFIINNVPKYIKKIQNS